MILNFANGIDLNYYMYCQPKEKIAQILGSKSTIFFSKLHFVVVYFNNYQTSGLNTLRHCPLCLVFFIKHFLMKVQQMLWNL